MTKSKLLATALVTVSMLATPAVARTNNVISRVIVHPSQVQAISLARYRFAPTAPQQNINQDLSRYGGETPPVLKP
jgi:hypothetical protein